MSSNINEWTTEDVCNWLQENGLGDWKLNFKENDIDGETLLLLTERMLEILIPQIKPRIKYMKNIEALRVSSNLPHCSIPLFVPALQPRPSLRDALEEKDVKTKKLTSTSISPQDVTSYSLPQFPKDVVTTLSTNTFRVHYKSGSKYRRKIIESISNDLELKGIMQPSRRTYQKIIDKLFKEYPFLGNPDDWKMSLRRRMKTLRRNNPDYAFLKQKYGRTNVARRGRPRKVKVDEEQEQEPEPEQPIPSPVESDHEELMKQKPLLVMQVMRCIFCFYLLEIINLFMF